MNDILDSIYAALKPHFHLGWNLFLALVPLVLALGLFRHRERRGLLWWPLFFVFVAFLPNAAYTLTDIIHFVEEVRGTHPVLPTWTVIYLVIPKYALFMFVGFQCHVISLMRVGSYLRWLGHKSWVPVAELALNFLCAIGVFWGRYLRVNSWEIVTQPQRLASTLIHGMSDELSFARIGWYFIVITLFYWLTKTVNLAVWEYWQKRRLDMRFPHKIRFWAKPRNRNRDL